MRKWLILTHRYLGIALSLIFVSWFASGIAMLYGRGMPRLTSDLRLERLAPIDVAAVRLSASEALERAELDGTNRVTLLTVMGRPAYRFGGGGESTTVFADTGELLLDIDAAQAQTIAAAFVRLPENRLHHVAQADERRSVVADDSSGPDAQVHRRRRGADRGVCVGAQRGCDGADDTRQPCACVGRRDSRTSCTSRRFASINRCGVRSCSGRRESASRSRCSASSSGIVQLRITRPFSFARIGSYLPYSGWMRWHYVTGLVFGVFTLTFVFSGWLSMEPWGWATSAGRFGGGLREAFTSNAGDLGEFPSLTADSVMADDRRRQADQGSRIRPHPGPAVLPRAARSRSDAGTEIRGHEPYFAVRSRDAAQTVVNARTLQPHDRTSRPSRCSIA